MLVSLTLKYPNRAAPMAATNGPARKASGIGQPASLRRSAAP
jgi:hypothetical protein